ncbi:class II D-tagatose-bisphosphate aldolase non-catalytic subunit [Hafnia paralvei]|jgi:D-tagatose-1,6-bisphosphate aldolase subunit GatZ/KbaZ|uniref:class II D-tagatose-bisphosphate aldolase non-catalytic subunit n=1 Tax=Hafnia paralvei TaxID=546367 RepID=UPI00107B4CC5|nr:class II D-tagatose-bisphosphate aldolase, non-catalytic subunit [Hafnia paralvei]MCE9882509.1 class II D-tagatose-bisphosphate aldolase, non-catalytic subunit [Hafnia paralvei]MCE9908478.1 class II D-tagatose-bisphosphate aldolase, non-catalytic subunit [Hafnia paralvei]MCE9912439.1 class II D-tagatose-bisphosphate aldolase, non-catalytic subunit [Hafnia paralvei]NUN42705.1 class II D-tagatose-bisphosphate aldolase, non-catalytic subunit [Hafnia paralvei]UBM40770.1 class II D-tagatose-bisp
MKNSLKQYVDYIVKGGKSSMLGIGPMSPALIQACFELGKEKDLPLMFIASRNQVDADEFGAGYVNNWDQFRFAADLKAIAEKVGFDGDYFLCRDHGGPWQRDKERKDHIPEDQAMALARRSYEVDMDAGFDLLHIDPTKDPYVVGKAIDIEVVLQRTIDLIQFCEDYRKEKGLKQFYYEVGTEETNGGLTSIEAFEAFIIELNKRLDDAGLPRPLFIVGQTGTLTRLTRNVGHFNDIQANQLSDISCQYGVGLKEHNGDYLSDDVLLKHPGLGITAMNVAPAYGTWETRAYLKLHEVEKDLAEKALIPTASNFKTVLTKACVLSHKWEKWITEEHKNKSEEQIFSEPDLLKEILELSGHYNYEKDDVVVEMKKMFANLSQFGVEPQRYVINKIKDIIQNEAECFNMPGLTSRVSEA